MEVIKYAQAMAAFLANQIGYTDDGRFYILASSPNPSISDGVLVHEAALIGTGAAVLPNFLVSGHVASGRLVSLKTKVSSPNVEVNLLHPLTRDPPQRVTDFIRFAIENWRVGGVLLPLLTTLWLLFQGAWVYVDSKADWPRTAKQKWTLCGSTFL